MQYRPTPPLLRQTLESSLRLQPLSTLLLPSRDTHHILHQETRQKLRLIKSCAYTRQRSVRRETKLYFLGLKLMNCLSNNQKITTQRVKFAHQIWSGLFCCCFDVSNWMVAGCLAPDLFLILSSSPESETCPVWWYFSTWSILNMTWWSRYLEVTNVACYSNKIWAALEGKRQSLSVCL